MAIQKRFIHFKKFSDFNSKKLSANEANTQYTVGVSGEIQDGAPDVLYQSYCWIKDTKQQWTHGTCYDCSAGKDVTYSELKNLRDNAQLITGQQYRITDYVTTTTQFLSKSAGHQFDIIVTADDESTLNEKARAIQHEGDEYFANSNLAAWQIWYSLDNDVTRFAWADAENGKGVIYRMIDEFNNDVPYDFKNIIYVFAENFKYSQWGKLDLFYRNSSLDKVINNVQYFGWTSDSSPISWSEPNCWTTVDVPATDMVLYKTDGSTISYGGSILSVSLESSEKMTFDNNGTDDTISSSSTFDNVINIYQESSSTEETYFAVRKLNRIVFGNSCYSNTFGNDCYSNTFGNDCYNNTFGNSCDNNTFSYSCYSNSFGNNCYNNTFGNDCYNNTFGNSCHINTFGYACYNSTFGNSCHSNTFGNNCYNSTFGNDCYNNTFSYDCHSNTFGNSCYNNIFGKNCYSNSFGNNCYINTFGNDCYNNTFGDKCDNFHIIYSNSSGSMSFVKLLGYNSNLTIYNPAASDLAPENVIVMSGVGHGTVNIFKQNTTQIVYTDKDGNIAVSNYDDADIRGLIEGKQDTLVSGTNIKTINGESILGSGNITLSNGASAYVTDFTILDLYNWVGAQEDHEVDKAGLENALAANIPIFVPVGPSDEGFSGYEILNGYKEDLLYLWVSNNTYNSNGGFFIETNPLVGGNSLFSGTEITQIPYQEKLVSGTNIKTVNGTSILGSGNISIQGGEINVNSDWLEPDNTVDSYVKNRTHYLTGTKITSAGSYSIGTSTPIHYREKVYNLEIGVRTQIDTDRAGVYVTLGDDGILRVEDNSGVLRSYPIMAVSGVVPLDDMFIPETIARTSELKTINGESIVGSGNIEISGGSSGSGAYSEVSHGTSDTTFTLTPNVFHVWDEVASLTLTLGDETAGVANEFLFQFNSGSTATTLTLPDTIKWANDSAPTIEANMIYQISILKGLASVLVFDNTPLITFSIISFEAQAEEGMTWGEWTTSSYNTLNCTISGNYIFRYGSFVALNGVYVTTSDLIIADTNYIIIMPDM